MTSVDVSVQPIFSIVNTVLRPQMKLYKHNLMSRYLFNAVMKQAEILKTRLVVFLLCS